jgi:hypothetical protein
VIVEGEFGWSEDITLTFVSVRTWDLRRPIVPITYFIEKPFQNWSRKSERLPGTIFLYLDYQVLRRAARRSETAGGKKQKLGSRTLRAAGHRHEAEYD